MAVRRVAIAVGFVVILTFSLVSIHADQLITPVYDNVVYFASATQVISAGGSIIDDYGGFVTARLTDAQSNILRNQGAIVRLVDHKMGLGDYYGDWKLSPPNVPTALRAPTSSSMYLVQFRGPMRESWLNSLESNTQAVYDYVPNNALLVKATATQRAVITGLPYVRHLEPFHPGLKLGPGLPESGTAIYDALAQGDASRNAVVASIISAGGEIELQLTTGATSKHVLRFLAEPSEVEAVAAIPDVFSVDLTDVELRVATQRTSAKVQTNHTIAAGTGTVLDYRIHDKGINGSTQTIGDCDNGLFTQLDGTGARLLMRHVSLYDDTTHRFANGTASQPEITLNERSPLHRKVELFYAPEFPQGVFHGDGQDATSGWHGSMTSNILVGDARAAGAATGWGERNGNDGVAFAARLAMCDFHVTNPTLEDIVDSETGQPIFTEHRLDVYNYAIPDPAAYFEPGYDVGARVFSNSWGSGRLATVTQQPAPYLNGPSYTIAAHLLDDYILHRADFAMVFAAGNLGADPFEKGDDGVPGVFEPESLAKNVIGAGGLDADHQHVAPLSSWNICQSLVLKPDLVAQAKDVISARGGGDGYPTAVYNQADGTSYATPAIAGAGALIRDFLNKTATGNAREPTASLVRAMLVASARAVPDVRTDPTDPRACNIFPNGVQGWGMPNLDNILKFDDDPETVILFDEEDTMPVHVAGAAWTQSITIDPTKQLRVVLAWTDQPGLPYSPNPLVNDLDLVLVMPNETKIVANDRFGTGLPDIRNTIEGVILPSPSSSTYTIRIEGRNLPVLDQRFSVVVLNGPEAAV